MKKAFTLLEVLIVVVIVGILASLAIPMFQGARSKAITAEVLPNINCIEQSIELYIIEYGWPPVQLTTDLNEDPGFLADYDLPGESQYFKYVLMSLLDRYTIVAVTESPFPDDWLCSRVIMKTGQRSWLANLNHPWGKYLKLP